MRIRLVAAGRMPFACCPVAGRQIGTLTADPDTPNAALHPAPIAGYPGHPALSPGKRNT